MVWKSCPVSLLHSSVLGPHRPRHSGLPGTLSGNSVGTLDGITPHQDTPSHSSIVLFFLFVQLLFILMSISLSFDLCTFYLTSIHILYYSFIFNFYYNWQVTIHFFFLPHFNCIIFQLCTLLHFLQRPGRMLV